MNLYKNSNIYHNLTFFEYLDILKHDIDLYGVYVVAAYQQEYGDNCIDFIQL